MDATAENDRLTFLDAAVDALAEKMLSLLETSIGFQSISGREGEFVRFLQSWAKAEDLTTDLWESDREDLAKLAPLPSRHLPLAGRPTLVISLPQPRADRRSLIFNAHSDVVSAPPSQHWTSDPWVGTRRDQKIFGRGACDAKGPLVAALWAMLALGRSAIGADLGRILLEVVPGEEDCVGLGTLTSIARGYNADAAIILEPTEGLPRNASRGGYRFKIITAGKSVHGTVKWLGQDAIRTLRLVLDALEELEKRWNVRVDPLFAPYPIARPITVDSVTGGAWAGMVCDRCECAGYLELLPGDDVRGWGQKLREELLKIVSLAEPSAQIDVLTSEAYDGHETPSDSPVCGAAEFAIRGGEGISDWCGWHAFNSGCEAGLRASRLGTPTLVWGPGSLEQAHASDEFVRIGAVRDAALRLARFAAFWRLK